MQFSQNVYGYQPYLLKNVTWAVGSSLLCNQYTSGWTRPWAPPKKILDPPMYPSGWRRSSTLGRYSRVTEGGTGRLIQFCVSFTDLWSQNGKLSNTEKQNRSLIQSSPMAMCLVQWLKECNIKYKRQR